MKVTLGGDRLGSGNKNKIALRNYERSTHNLSQRWTSSMAPGVLYPFLVLPAMRGDKFEIDLEAAARTIPTKGPLFGSYKMQVDIFQCPIRLYQAILHNNPIDIGLKMSQVKLPLISVECKTYKDELTKGVKFSNSCLLKYLGVSGVGHCASQATDSYVYRNFNAVPLLAYYDIFKNYYSNKQEENAYVITSADEYEKNKITSVTSIFDGQAVDNIGWLLPLPLNDITGTLTMSIHFDQTLLFNTNEELLENIMFELKDETAGTSEDWSLYSLDDQYPISWNKTENTINIGFTLSALEAIIADVQGTEGNIITIRLKYANLNGEQVKEITLNSFPLKNIDLMRQKLLSYSELGTAFKITNDDLNDYDDEWTCLSGADNKGYPYTANTMRKGEGQTGDTYNVDPLNGLMIKTYQSDLFNNWINTDWIEGENGIAAVTAISTASGDKFTIDSLNLAEKLYNMLNRIAVSGGTYQDWQDAVYTESPIRHIESPVYLGGMSSEIVFEEIVQSAPGESADGTTELGTLGGRGVLLKRKGGNVTVKCDEASFIIGIVSLTPRIMYTQGNEFYMTDLKSIDDFHKPALDGIGFQDLIAERAAWWDTVITPEGSTILSRHKLGKVPAWIEYMTAVDKAYGDFAEEGGKGFMVLNRNYEVGDYGTIKDATTYVDPTKYNYAFAYTELQAQNFWVQIQSNIRARRLMSAKQIPNI